MLPSVRACVRARACVCVCADITRSQIHTNNKRHLWRSIECHFKESALLVTLVDVEKKINNNKADKPILTNHVRGLVQT